jgi:hypothetical protein
MIPKDLIVVAIYTDVICNIYWHHLLKLSRVTGQHFRPNANGHETRTAGTKLPRQPSDHN